VGAQEVHVPTYVPIRSVVVICCLCLLVGCAKEGSQQVASSQPLKAVTEKTGESGSGEALFKQYCFSCHPDGGNVSDPGRPLYGAVLKRNRITTPEDVVRIMRHPLSRMIRFDVSTLSDKDARAIAEYVLITFK
jgi:cytochrome c6